MTSAFSWQNSISLCPTSFRIPRPNLPVTPGVSWLPTFAFQSPIMKRTYFLVLVLKGLVGLHRTIQIQLFSVTGWGIDLDHHDIEWFALEMNRDHSVVFETASKYCISDSCWPWWLLHFFWGILACSSRYDGHLNYIHPFPSILPHRFLRCWYLLLLDHLQLTLVHGPNIPVPMQYCSLQHCTLLSHHPHSQLSIISTLAQLLHSFWSY